MAKQFLSYHDGTISINFGDNFINPLVTTVRVPVLLQVPLLWESMDHKCLHPTQLSETKEVHAERQV